MCVCEIILILLMQYTCRGGSGGSCTTNSDCGTNGVCEKIDLTCSYRDELSSFDLAYMGQREKGAILVSQTSE
jgi:hypothetical protein